MHKIYPLEAHHGDALSFLDASISDELMVIGFLGRFCQDSLGGFVSRFTDIAYDDGDFEARVPPRLIKVTQLALDTA